MAPFFADLLRILENFYSSHSGLPHFRLVSRSPRHLASRGASLRVSVEAPAPGLGGYVEVGSLSCYGDYLARRMTLKQEGEPGRLQNLRVVAGTMVDVTKLLGCLLECRQQMTD